MSSRIFALTIGLATCLGVFNEPLFAQRGNVLENLGKSLLNEAINGGQRQPPRTSTPTQPRVQQQQAPNESGRTPGSNPYGGRWGNVIQPQPQPQPQPRPGVIPRQSPPGRAYPPSSSQRFDTYYYGPPRSSGNPINPRSYQQQVPATIQPRPYYGSSQPQSAGPINITYSKTQEGTCEFSLVSGSAEFPRTMSPGQMQQLDGSSVWKIRFTDNGMKKTFRLTPGSDYVFLRNSRNSLVLLVQVKPIAVTEDTPSQN